MPPTPTPTEITLRIKVPPGYLPPSVSTTSTDPEQFSLGTIPTATTLGALRLQIQALVPTHPAPERQRILYGGRALVDEEQTIGDALNVKRDPTQGDYVVHLLVKGDGVPSRSSTPSGHSRTASMPVAATNPPGAVQPQPGLPPSFTQSSFLQQAHMMQHHQAVARQLEMQQQALRQQHGVAPAPTQQTSGNGSNQTAGGQIPLSGQVNAPSPTPTQPAGQQPNPQQRGGQGFHIQGVGPDGQRFQIQQHTIHVPHGQVPHAVPGQLPFGMMPGVHNPTNGVLPPPLPQGAFAQRPGTAPSALDRARENMAEMRRMLDELASQTGGNNDGNAVQERRRRIEEIQGRVRSVENYIDPFRMSTATTNTGADTSRDGGTRSTSPRPPAPAAAMQNPAWPWDVRNILSQNRQPALLGLPPLPPQQAQRSLRPSTDVTAYLLSSPQGPQAILFSPEHGTYTGSMPTTNPQPTFAPDNAAPQPLQPQQQVVAAPNNVPADPVAQVAQRQLLEVANAQAQAGNDANGNPQAQGLQPILGHFWLLFRILVFAYFLLGTNLGWQRPLILVVIGVGFYMVRAGLLGDGGVVRRWWEGVLGAQAPAAAEGQQPAPAAAAGQRAPMPTPEQVAARLLNEADARRRERGNWLREQLRPVERAVALFVASLWPGIGEGYVREQRRLREEAEAQARAEQVVEGSGDAGAGAGEKEKEKESVGEGNAGSGSGAGVGTSTGEVREHSTGEGSGTQGN